MPLKRPSLPLLKPATRGPAGLDPVCDDPGHTPAGYAAHAPLSHGEKPLTSLTYPFMRRTTDEDYDLNVINEGFGVSVKDGWRRSTLVLPRCSWV